MVIGIYLNVNLFLDGSILPVNLRQKVYSNGTLIIEQVQRQTDAGTYTCQAKNHHGHSSRRDIEIQVLSTCLLILIQYIFLFYIIILKTIHYIILYLYIFSSAENFTNSPND